MHAGPVPDFDPDPLPKPDPECQPHAESDRGTDSVPHAGTNHTDTNSIRDTHGPWSAPRHAGAAVSALSIA